MKNRSTSDVDMVENDEDHSNGKEIEQGSVEYDSRIDKSYKR